MSSTDTDLDPRRAYLLNASAYGMALAADQLDLTSSTKSRIRHLAKLIETRWSSSASTKRVDGRKQSPSVLAGRLYEDIRVELDVAYGGNCDVAFALSCDLLQTQFFFRVIIPDPEEYKAFFFSTGDDHIVSVVTHRLASIGLENFLRFCEGHRLSHVSSSQVRRLVTGFSNRSLTASELQQLRHNLVGPWRNSLERYFAPIGVMQHIADEHAFRQMLIDCARLGHMCGAFEPLSELPPVRQLIERTRKDVTRCNLLLKRLNIPFDIRQLASRLCLPRRSRSSRPPNGLSPHLEYRYAIIWKIQEAIEALYGQVPRTLFSINSVLGAIEPLVYFAPDNLITPHDDPVVSHDTRDVITPYLTLLVSELRCSYVRRHLRNQATAAISVWKSESSSSHDVDEARIFLLQTFRDNLLADVARHSGEKPRRHGSRYDIFLSHASEDKDRLARPLYKALVAAGITVWFDEAVLDLGDSLRRRIDEGLARCRFGVVILSPRFFEKHWPQRELDGLVARATASGENLILPIWLDVEREEVLAYSPPLADRVAGRADDGIPELVKRISRVLVS